MSATNLEIVLHDWHILIPLLRLESGDGVIESDSSGSQAPGANLWA